MSEKRYLTQGEIDLLTEIYGERDYFYQTTIERGNWYMLSGFGLVSNNNIKVGKLAYSDDFSQTAPEWFIHEGAHLVQEQTFGRHLAWSKGSEKFMSPLSNNYQYSDEVRKGIPFDEMAIEAQASMISDYYRAVQGKPGRYTTLPVEVYQSIIPESYVPSFGRYSSDDPADKKAGGATDDKQQATRKVPNTLQESEAQQYWRVPSPRSKPNRKHQPDYPLSDTPLMTGAKDILQPSFSPGQQVKEFDLAPVLAPSKGRSIKGSSAGRANSLRGNPFNLEKTNLKLQTEMIERNPVMAKRMNLAEKRDPKLFGFG